MTHWVLEGRAYGVPTGTLQIGTVHLSVDDPEYSPPDPVSRPARAASEWDGSWQSGTFVGDVDRTLAPYLLAATIRSGRPLEVRWERAYRLVAGRWTLLASLSWAWARREMGASDNAVESLDTYEALARLLAASDEAMQAATRCRAAYGHLRNDASATCALAYLAVEGLVESVRGNTQRSDWETAAPALGLSPEQAGHLFDSLQIGRHHNPTRSLARLARDDQAPYTAVECCDLAAAAIEGFAQSRATGRDPLAP